ncbi:MAG: acyl-ACP--UDP-N-acetylglucosamine O-acyltransferase [Chromatiales bacterium]|jgi:UDP-N-acetylglucosamine acyltransferase
MIHPTALVDPDAQLAEDVEVGPYTIIGAGVTIDSGSVIGSHVVIRGETSIGRNNRIFQFASVGEDPQDKKYDGEATRLVIGDGNTIREFATIHRGTVQDTGETRIGNRNLLMAYTHVAHDCILSDDIVLSNAASLAGHVHIQDHAILSGFALVHQFCSIGQHAFIGMGAHITRDVLPYILVAGEPPEPKGLNSEGLRRRGFDQQQLNDIKQAYKLLFASGLKLGDATHKVEAMAENRPHLAVMADFLKTSRRSLLR